MENAADALKIVFGFFVFVFAVSLSISTFSNARQSIDNIITYRDKNESYVEIQNSNDKNRFVGAETIVEAMYKAYTENYRIEFFKKSNNGNQEPLVLYTKIDNRGNTQEETGIYYLDLEDEEFANSNIAIQHLNSLLTNGQYTDRMGNRYKAISEYVTKNSAGNRTLTAEEISSECRDGVYKYFLDKTFEEHVGEYYQEDKDAGHETEALEINKTKKRIITYIMQ